MANVYLDKLDQWITEKKGSFDKGKNRKTATEYATNSSRIHRCRVKLDKLYQALKEGPSDVKTKEMIQLAKANLKELQEKQKGMSCTEPMDPNYRRLVYCRYADDFIIGVIGSRQEAQGILEETKSFLKTLNLEVSEEKTRINHSRTKTRFLGYDIATYNTDKPTIVTTYGRRHVQRVANGNMYRHIPKEKLISFFKGKNMGNLEGKPAAVLHRPELLNLDDLEIISTYNAELRGLANYYSLARCFKQRLSKLMWYAEISLAKTLAGKHKCSIQKIYSRYKENGRLAVKYRTKKGEQIRYAFNTKDMPTKVDKDRIDTIPNTFVFASRTSLVSRLLAGTCEHCGKSEGTMEVHHVRKLADVAKKKDWASLKMIQRKRKTIVLCKPCHTKLHQGKLGATE